MSFVTTFFLSWKFYKLGSQKDDQTLYLYSCSVHGQDYWLLWGILDNTMFHVFYYTTILYPILYRQHTSWKVARQCTTFLRCVFSFCKRYLMKFPHPLYKEPKWLYFMWVTSPCLLQWFWYGNLTCWLVILLLYQTNEYTLLIVITWSNISDLLPANYFPKHSIPLTNCTRGCLIKSWCGHCVWL